MPRICMTSGLQTRCADSCKECARELWHDLIDQCGNGELTQATISNVIGTNGFIMLRRFGFIKDSRIVDGVYWYKI
jgi:hypothetical protein